MSTTAISALALLALCLVLFALLPRKPYKRAPFLFTPAERAFYKQLVAAVNGEYLVFGKVRVADLVTIKGKYGSKTSMRDLARVAQKHVDFCLCHPQSLAVICAIELNDKSHQREDRASRDRFLSEVFRNVGLPIVWMPAQNGYSTSEIRQAIKTSLDGVEPQSPAPKEDRTGPHRD